jgi:uncharacterized protein (DUF427 family)
MTLTLGHGPFGSDPAGRFNFSRNGPAHVLFWDPSPKRARAFFAGEAVVDSRRGALLHETGLLPVWYFPPDDVRSDLLVPTDRRTTCPFKGEASYWSITVGDRTAENAVWGYPQPLESAPPPLAGHLAFYADALDAWFEEDEQVIGHPRDPYHRIDVRQGSQHVRVRVGDEVVAESTRPRLLFETGLPARYYLPEEDLRTEVLAASATTTVCPYKGIASYRSFKGPGPRQDDVAWAYPEPLPEAVPVAGHWSFLGDGVEIEVDGQLLATDG